MTVLLYVGLFELVWGLWDCDILILFSSSFYCIISLYEGED